MIKKSSRSQITIFIIIGLIIIVAIALLFVLVRKPSESINYAQNPQAYIQKCVGDSISATEKKIIDGNGYFNMSSNYLLYSGNKPQEKVPYLCMASQFYIPCINQEPMLLEVVRKEIENEVQKSASRCFSDLLNILKKAGYDTKIEADNPNYTRVVDFANDAITADFIKKITATKNTQTQTYEKFSIEVKSPLFRILDTERNIINYESTLCEFNTLNWMATYRDLKIDRFTTGDNSKIYTITDKETGKRMSFAVRTCVLPAGI
jgi:hypothetical protein